MNKKQIAALVETMVTKVAEQQGISEDAARTLVGISIQKNQDALCGVTLPSLAAPAAE